jgi:uncharacterized protein YcfJ
MSKRIVAIVAVASVLCGCAHVHPAGPVVPGPPLDDLNRALRNRELTVELSTSTTGLKAESVSVMPDSISMTLCSGARRDTTVSAREVRTITATSHARGAVDGALLGFAVGGARGAAVGGVVGVVILGVFGAVPGLLIGALAGTRHAYDFTTIGLDLREGDRVSIHTLRGDVIDDAVVRVSWERLECNSHSIAYADMSRLERTKGTAPPRASAAAVVGEPTGLSLEFAVGRNWALAGAVGYSAWQSGWFNFHVDCLYHRQGFGPQSIKGRSPHYVGVGVGSSSRPSDVITLELRVPIGWEFVTGGHSRAGVFLELAPLYRFDPYEPGLLLRAAAGVRFWF